MWPLLRFYLKNRWNKTLEVVHVLIQDRCRFAFSIRTLLRFICKCSHLRLHKTELIDEYLEYREFIWRLHPPLSGSQWVNEAVRTTIQSWYEQARAKRLASSGWFSTFSSSTRHFQHRFRTFSGPKQAPDPSGYGKKLEKESSLSVWKNTIGISTGTGNGWENLSGDCLESSLPSDCLTDEWI